MASAFNANLADNGEMATSEQSIGDCDTMFVNEFVPIVNELFVRRFF